MPDTLIAEEVGSRCDAPYITLVFTLEPVISGPYITLFYDTGWTADLPNGGFPAITRGQEFPNGGIEAGSRKTLWERVDW